MLSVELLIFVFLVDFYSFCSFIGIFLLFILVVVCMEFLGEEVVCVEFVGFVED